MTSKMVTMFNEQALLGSLMGDGGLHVQKKSKNPCYQERHSSKQLNYLKWKNEFLNFKLYFINAYRKYKHEYVKVPVITSGADSRLWNYYTLFYPKGKKTVSKQILERLNPLAIAIWYCDDGSYDYCGQRIRLCTDCFSHYGRLLIIQYFKQKYDIKFYISEKSLRLKKLETVRFLKLIRGYIPKCMNYKLGKDLQKLKQNKDKKRRYDKEYYKKNIDRIQCRNKEYHKRHRENILHYQKRWYKENRDNQLCYQKEYRKKNKDRIKRKRRKKF